MVKKYNIDEIKDSFKPSVACIGYFDGLHIGHQELISRTIEEADKNNCRSMVICFEPDPLDVITGKRQRHILSYDERISMMQELGIDDITVIRFDEKVMRMDALDFIENCLNRMNLIELVCGFDFTFGHEGKGDSGLLEKNGRFKVNVVEEIDYEGTKVSSTWIKNEIRSGNFSLVSRLLDYDYYLPLIAIKSSRNGSKWLVEARLEDGRRVVPDNIEKIFDTVSYRNGTFYIQSDIDMDTGEQMTIIFEDE